eukprot:3971047-Pyramimonas_sp.AAC.1
MSYGGLLGCYFIISVAAAPITSSHVVAEEYKRGSEKEKAELMGRLEMTESIGCTHLRASRVLSNCHLEQALTISRRVSGVLSAPLLYWHRRTREGEAGDGGGAQRSIHRGDGGGATSEERAGDGAALSVHLTTLPAAQMTEAQLAAEAEARVARAEAAAVAAQDRLRAEASAAMSRLQDESEERLEGLRWV